MRTPASSRTLKMCEWNGIAPPAPWSASVSVGEQCISESSTTAESSESQQHSESAVQSASSGYASGTSVEEGSNITDEEKAVAAKMSTHFETMQRNFSLSNRPFLEAIFNALDCTESDHAALFALCVLYALGHNPGINQDLLDSVLMPSEKSETKFCYNVNLAERLIQIINLSCQYSSKIRYVNLADIFSAEAVSRKDEQPSGCGILAHVEAKS
ncbi:Protein CLEC16A [Araneus ventricosus]|uniref:Protein CLEC16A n=1 Tax=Araneus ventricosus TaxID=182803 RepID=A0A4Y2L1R9_ARAVE|nr:Protein CLEC16A [Araneus ventricosus]